LNWGWVIKERVRGFGVRVRVRYGADIRVGDFRRGQLSWGDMAEGGEGGKCLTCEADTLHDASAQLAETAREINTNEMSVARHVASPVTQSLSDDTLIESQRPSL